MPTRVTAREFIWTSEHVENRCRHFIVKGKGGRIKDGIILLKTEQFDGWQKSFYQEKTRLYITDKSAVH